MNTFKFNGTLLTLQPTDHNWEARNQFGMSGDGHPIYPLTRQYRLTWSLSSPSEFQQVLGFYNSISQTGTIAVDLPEWNNATYQFRTYSGCTLREPEFSNFYEGYYQEITMTVLNIRV